MKKEDILLKTVIWVFYGIGGFWLASIILLGFFLNFIVDLIPECGWTHGSISVLDCGHSLKGKVLSSYFASFTPYIGYFLVIVSAYYFYAPFVNFPSQFHPAIFNTPLSVFLLALLIPIYIVPFVIAYKVFKRLVWRRRDYSLQQQRSAFIFLGLILLPTLCVGLLKLYIEPPRFINRTITVDLWHADLKIERRFLDKWTLVSLPKPEKEFPFLMIHSRGYKIFPYARLEVSYRDLNPSFADDGKILITVKPHFDAMTAHELSEKLQKTLDNELSQFTFGHKSGYKPAGRQMDFEVLEFTGQRSGQPDFYLHKDAEGQIQNLLECTPDTHCITPFGRGWNQKPCENEDACKSCLRVCTDKSQGTGMLDIEYRFDKKYLDSYFVLHQEVLDFVAARTVVKSPVKFVFNRQNVKLWSEEGIRIKIELNEEGRLKLEQLSRENLNKSIDLYIENLKLGSPFFRETINKSSINFVFDDPLIHKKVITLLPADKRLKE